VRSLFLCVIHLMKGLLRSYTSLGSHSSFAVNSHPLGMKKLKGIGNPVIHLLLGLYGPGLSEQKLFSLLTCVLVRV
jgi:hypothetical protein